MGRFVGMSHHTSCITKQKNVLFMSSTRYLYTSVSKNSWVLTYYYTNLLKVSELDLILQYFHPERLDKE